MKYIAYKDVQALLESVRILHSDISQKTLPERMIAAVGNIINTEIVAFDGFGGDDQFTTTAWNDRPELYTPENLDIFREFVHQHPLIPVVIGGKLQNAIKMTDYITQAEFEKLELYNEYFRLIGVRRQMGMALPVSDGYTFSCSVNRLGEDFSERDRRVLTLLTPHLVNAVRNSAAFERVGHVLESKKCGMATISTSGRVIYAGDFSRRLIEKYFPFEKFCDSQLPAAVCDWIKQSSSPPSEYQTPGASFIVRNTEGELKIGFAPQSGTGEPMILFEEKKYPCPQMLEQLNLTRREAEVLFWMTQGKTDDEIGKILFISPYTVRKHAQKIYIKLGVETRTAATSKAAEIFS